jgi:hypothetical protein
VGSQPRLDRVLHHAVTFVVRAPTVDSTGEERQNRRPPRPPAGVEEVDTSDLFLPAVRRRFREDIAYTTSDYLDLLGTYSDHRALAPAHRQSLLACIAELIDQKYGGRIIKRYMYELRVARRATIPVTFAVRAILRDVAPVDNFQDYPEWRALTIEAARQLRTHRDQILLVP